MYEYDELYHHGVKGMKWGVRRTPAQLGYNSNDSAVTKRVKKDYNTMSDREFMNKYQTTKRRYAKRVVKYGDPYMKSPLAKTGKALAAKQQTNKRQTDNRKINKGVIAKNLVAVLVGGTLGGMALGTLAKSQGASDGAAYAALCLGSYMGASVVDDLFFRDAKWIE